jgi:hypothetical protein
MSTLSYNYYFLIICNLKYKSCPTSFTLTSFTSRQVYFLGPVLIEVEDFSIVYFPLFKQIGSICSVLFGVSFFCRPDIHPVFILIIEMYPISSAFATADAAIIAFKTLLRLRSRSPLVYAIHWPPATTPHPAPPDSPSACSLSACRLPAAVF